MSPKPATALLKGTKHMPRVGVLVDTSTSWGRSILKGIGNYMRKHEPWQVFVEARGLEERLHLPKGWRGDGIIARIADSALVKELHSLQLPVVNVSGIRLPNENFPRVTTDLEASGRLAASYLLDRGFRHFAYFSLIGLDYVSAHQEAFICALAEAGCPCEIHAVKPRTGAEPDWMLDLAQLGRWLKRLPKPVAILAWNASSGREIIYAAHEAGIIVPEEVAVLSGSDDDVLCEFLQIPLSAITASAEQIGHEAASLLDRLMRRRSAPKEPVLIPPLGVTTRQSTETLAIHDRAMVAAISFVRQNADKPIQVDDIAKHAGISRRVLERRFLQILSRTPAEEIRRVHFAKAKQLLVETDLAIPDVAEGSGFGSPEYMAYVFKTEIGQTPLNYRKQVRSR
jgi:LacI family transcriptional regulator